MLRVRLNTAGMQEVTLRKVPSFPKNVEELLLEATKEDEDDYEGSNDDALEDEFTDESFDDEN